MTIFRRIVVLLALSCLSASATAQSTVTLFDEDPAPELGYRDVSAGFAEGGDELNTFDGRMPLADSSFSGAVGGLVEYRHVPGGHWEMEVGTDDYTPVDIAGFDTLELYLNGPAPIAGGELPRIALRDAANGTSVLHWLSVLEDVRPSPSSGFRDGAPTDAVISVAYRDVLDPTLRHPGYPEDITITFADAPLDTSIAAIGAPATPSNFMAVTAAGLQLDFQFRDTNGDGTLSASDEYINLLTPDDFDTEDQSQTWRVTLNGVPAVPPGDGDVYDLIVEYEEFNLDDDPSTWQRIAIPMIDLAGGGLDVTQANAVVFQHGGVNDDSRTLWFDRVVAIQNDDKAFLDEVQAKTFDFFWQEANPANGLVRDRSHPNSASSIAAVGFGLSAYTVGIDRGYITREQGADRVLTTLEFFWNAPQHSGPTNVTGYKGFFYHFLNMDTGYRAGTNELSTIDTALLLAGVLHAQEYFDGADPDEVEIRALADSIYRRVDWQWAVNNPPLVTLSWEPEEGYSNFDWRGYNEAMIIYILGLGSPTYPLEPEAWTEWTAGYDWETHYGYSFVRFPPLFGHQYTHTWVDFRGIQDDYMRGRGIDYFENSRRATLAQREYHIDNPRGYPNYDRDEWGLTASQVPTGYRARGAPPAQNDDGTLAPTAPGGSMAFTPEESIAALRTMRKRRPSAWGVYGFRDAYNVSQLWYTNEHLGIDQGPILLMAENYRTEAVWDTFMQNEYVQTGLERAGFRDTDTGVDDPGGVDQSIALSPPWPNPSADRVYIEFRLPDAENARLTLVDLLGRTVAVVADRLYAAGTHRVAWDSGRVAAGLYFVRLDAAGETTVRSVVVR